MEKFENVIRNLTVSQIDSLNAFFEVKKELVSSEEIADRLKKGTGKSLSALASLQHTTTPILQKYGKMSAREGALWCFNPDFGDKKLVEHLVTEIMSKYKSSGVINGTNP